MLVLTLWIFRLTCSPLMFRCFRPTHTAQTHRDIYTEQLQQMLSILIWILSWILESPLSSWWSSCELMWRTSKAFKNSMNQSRLEAQSPTWNFFFFFLQAETFAAHRRASHSFSVHKKWLSTFSTRPSSENQILLIKLQLLVTESGSLMKT